MKLSNWIQLTLMVCMLHSSVAIAKLSASLERPTITLGESVRLTVSSDQDQSGLQLDTSAFQKDFDIIAKSSSTQVTMINGSVSKQTNTSLELRPKRLGSLVVPSASLGTEKTAALSLIVTAASAKLPASESGQASPVIIEAEWEEQPDKVYVQQQLNLVVRILYLNALQDASLDEPRPDNTLVKRFNPDRQGTKMHNGRQYRMLERRYALFPQQSGKLIIPSIPMQMRVQEKRQQQQRSFPFSIFNQGRMVTVQTQPISVDVLPPNPAFSGGVWLPSEKVEIMVSGLPNSQVMVGDAINMQVDFSALGLSGEQLPALQIADLPAGLKLYPDEPSFESSSDGQVLKGVRKQTFVLIPSTSGKLSLPEMSLHWWDTKADKQRIAKLKAVTIDVIPAVLGNMTDGLAGDLSNEAANNSSYVGQPPQNGVGSPSGISSRTSDEPSVPSFWKWLALAALFAWGGTLALWLRLRTSLRPKAVSSATVTELDLTSILKKIKQAAVANQADVARQGLQQFSKTAWLGHAPVTPEEWAVKLVHPEIESVLAELDAMLYRGDEASDWNGQALKAIVLPTLTEFVKQAKRPKAKEATKIPSLYPQSA